jgi:uncharacterized membrane protein YkvA (DUF1232 family)
MLDPALVGAAEARHICTMPRSNDMGDDPRDFDAQKLERDRELVKARFFDKLRGVLGRIPFVDDVLATYYCAMDSRTPTFVKAIMFGALAYFITPMDVIPDVIAGLGFTDDASVLTAAIAVIGKYVLPEHREKARQWLRTEMEETADDEKQS